MKLLYCPICRDVHGVIAETWRMCLCKSSGAQYNKDGMTATVGGVGKIFGVGNFPFFDPLFIHLTEEKKRELRQQHYGQPDTDAWWGEYPGDLQIFRIDSAKGPRLEINIKRVNSKNNRVIIIDKREYSIDGKSLGAGHSVVVPANIHFMKKSRWSPKNG